MRLLLLDCKPQAIALTNDDWALVLRDCGDCAVSIDFCRSQELAPAIYTLLHDAQGFLGLLECEEAVYAFFVRRFAEEACDGVAPIERVYKYAISRMSVMRVILSSTSADVLDLLEDGCFYCSTNPGSVDLTRRTQLQADQPVTAQPSSSSCLDVADERFLWNLHLLNMTIDYRQRLPQAKRQALDRGGFILYAVQGFLGSCTLATADAREAIVINLISRRRHAYAGTRFLTRGLDAEGNAANCVETELVVARMVPGPSGEWLPTSEASWVTIRGSAPLLWTQSLHTGPQVKEPMHISSLVPFLKHVSDLVDEYDDVNLVNLMRQAGGGESVLSQDYRLLYEAACEASNAEERLHWTPYDFPLRKPRLSSDAASLAQTCSHLYALAPLSSGGFFHMCAVQGQPKVAKRQCSIMRVNCRDCCDRTNICEGLLAELMLEEMLGAVGSALTMPDCLPSLDALFAKNGDALSRFYTGGDAMGHNVLQKHKGDSLHDLVTNEERSFYAEFLDERKQRTINTLLGKRDYTSTLPA